MMLKEREAQFVSYYKITVQLIKVLRLSPSPPLLLTLFANWEGPGHCGPISRLDGPYHKQLTDLLERSSTSYW